jgi:DNA-binding NarL/FixJ family response regulator
MPRVVAYMDDLIFQMKLAETAKHLRVEIKVAASPDALLQLMDPLPKFVIVDLNARNSPLEAIEKLRVQQPTLPVICFLSHMQTDLAAKAKAAGFQQVMARSQFTANLPQILAMAND